MSFDSFEPIQSSKQVTKRNWGAFLNQIKTRGGFFVNDRSATFANMMMISKGGKYAVFFQEKQRKVAKQQALKRRKVPQMNYEKVKKEHEKCNVITPHLFVMITDEDFEDWTNLKENEIVLSPAMHGDAISPQLALLRKHNHAH